MLTEAAAKMLCDDGAATDFVKDAYGHLKAIGHNAGAQPLLDKVGVKADEGVTGLGDEFLKAAAQRFFDREPKVHQMP